MQPTLDLADFVWVNKETKNAFLILALTMYKDENVVVYRPAHDRVHICVCSVSDFCRDFEATYDISHNKS